jgi:hypothetical protein
VGGSTGIRQAENGLASSSYRDRSASMIAGSRRGTRRWITSNAARYAKPARMKMAIDDPAYHQQPNGVGNLKGEDDIAVVDFAPAELALQYGLQQADHLPVDIIDRSGEEQQSTDRPAVTPDLGCFCRPDRRSHYFASTSGLEPKPVRAPLLSRSSARSESAIKNPTS